MGGWVDRWIHGRNNDWVDGLMDRRQLSQEMDGRIDKRIE